MANKRGPKPKLETKIHHTCRISPQASDCLFLVMDKEGAKKSQVFDKAVISYARKKGYL